MGQILTENEILEFLRKNTYLKNDEYISNILQLKGSSQKFLSNLFNKSEKKRSQRKRFLTSKIKTKLSRVDLLIVKSISENGTIYVSPPVWEESSATPLGKLLNAKDMKLKTTDKVLARIVSKIGYHVEEALVSFEAKIIHKIVPEKPKTTFALLNDDKLISIHGNQKKVIHIAKSDQKGLENGDILELQTDSQNSVQINKTLGKMGKDLLLCDLAILQHELPTKFKPETLVEASQLHKFENSNEISDLTHLPFITIDPETAKDHDDAIFVSLNETRSKKKVFNLLVAIADVAGLIKAGSSIDREAFERGNSTYLPEKVIPMLPEQLSNDLCSLKANAERACIIVKICLDSFGKKINHEFIRGRIRVKENLTYSEMQKAIDGETNQKTKPLFKPVIMPIWEAYRALVDNKKNNPLHLNFKEQKVCLSETVPKVRIITVKHLESHNIIEEFMVLANVCSAESLHANNVPSVYRVHEEPSEEKSSKLLDTLKSMNLSSPKSKVLSQKQLNSILNNNKDSRLTESLNLNILRSMPQAYYSRKNAGHFGLDLELYTHFTSPIRRYSDIIVHRALFIMHGWDKNKYHKAPDNDVLDHYAKHISQTERRSIAVERDTNDRYLAEYLKNDIGSVFKGRISSVTRFGLFVKLEEIGAEGLVPISSIGNEYYRMNETEQTIRGMDSGVVIKVGGEISVELKEASSITGKLRFSLLEYENQRFPMATKKPKKRRAFKKHRS